MAETRERLIAELETMAKLAEDAADYWQMVADQTSGPSLGPLPPAPIFAAQRRSEANTLRAALAALPPEPGPTPAPSREEREADDRVVGMLVERCKRVFKTGKTCREGDGPFGYCVNCLASAEIERLKAARPSRADCERALELAQSSARAGHRSWLMRRASKMADARRLLQLDPTPMDDK